MIICPVCEHQQPPASECAVCGRALAVQRVAQPVPQRMPELEVTRHAVAASPPVAGPLPEIEPNRAMVGNVPVEAIADLDTGRFVDASERTPYPTGALTCRYCRNVQEAGALCDRCGMRLPKYAPPTKDIAEAAPEDGPQVAHGCGAITRAGMPCGGCGVFVPWPAE